MTDIAEMPTLPDDLEIKGKNKIRSGTHFIISSGNHIKSYLTLAIDHVPITTTELRKVSITNNEEPVEISKIVRIF
jgi:hypothetical protein